MPRFIYSASSVAVAAKFGGASPLNRAWATATLPMIGGEDISTEKGPNGNPVLSFSTATAQVQGFESGGVYTTVNTVAVTDLNVLNKLTAHKIEVSLRFDFNIKEELTVTLDGAYGGLLIDGVSYENVTWDNEIARSAGRDHRKFRHDLVAGTVLKGRSHIHKTKAGVDQKAHASLAKDPDGRLGNVLDLPTHQADYGFVDVDGFFRVYFGAWSQDENYQGVVGLRIVLDDAQPAAPGEIVVADDLGNNGQFFP